MRILLGRPAPKHREDSPSSTHHFVWANWSRRWRWRRTTRSGSPSSRSSGRACSRAGYARPPGSTRSFATTVYWVALLRFIGCTGHAHEVSTLFGDEIAIRGQTLVHDSGNPAEVMRDILAFATAGRDAEEREEIVRKIQETIREWAFDNFSSGCEVADVLVERLDFGPDVREALRCTFECWNGNGHPNHVKGEAIPLPMRIVHVSHDMEAIGRLLSPERALEAARERRGETYDPAVADVFLAHGREWFDRLGGIEPWDAVLALEPEPHRLLAGADLDDALSVVADFIDLKSPYWGGHSRRCAKLAEDAAGVLGLADAEVTTLRRAALVHDFGTTVVPNSIWDKPGPLTRSEFDRVELHPMLTEQMLRRSPALAVLNPVACAHHEKCDGSGYHKRVQAAADHLGRVRPRRDGGLRRADRRASGPPAVLRRRRGRRPAPARVGRRARASREPCRAGGRRARRAAGAHGQAAAEPGRAHAPRGRGAPARGEGPHDARDRGSPLHLAQDRRPPHPAHLRQDRRFDAGRGSSLGDAAHRGFLTGHGAARREPEQLLHCVADLDEAHRFLRPTAQRLGLTSDRQR